MNAVLRLEQTQRLEQFMLLCLDSPCKSLSSKKEKKNKTDVSQIFFPKCFELQLTSKEGRSSPGKGSDEYIYKVRTFTVVDVHHTQLQVLNELVQERGRSCISRL